METATIPQKHKSGLDLAIEDIAAGRVYHADNVDDFIAQLTK